jgi:hypothetical protein
MSLFLPSVTSFSKRDGAKCSQRSYEMEVLLYELGNGLKDFH